MNKLAKFLLFISLIITSSVHADNNSEGMLSALPPDINSNDTSPYQILMAHYNAIGGLEALKNVKTSYTKGKITFAGMSGYFQSWSQTPLRYRLETHYPAFSTIEGDNGEQMWTIDLNHKRLILMDEHSIKRRKLRGLLDRFENIQPDSQFFKLKLIAIEKVKGEKCYVIETRNTINEDIYYDFISTHSFFLLKSTVQQAYLKLETYYSDFKKIDNIVYSLHSKTDISPTAKEIITQIDKILINQFIPPEKFLIPDVDVKDYHFENNDSSESIPFLLSENNIYIAVKIQGEEHYWILDSGADISVIDMDYADKMGLIAQGKLSGNTTNHLVEYNYVKLPEYQIKGVKLFDQTLLSYKGLANNFFEPDAVGILGYDFLSRFITKIDYAKQTLSFFQPQHFSYKGAGNKITSPLQNKFFMLPVIINEQHQGNYAMDLGSFNVSMNYPFAKKHGFIEKNGVLRLSSDIAGVFYERQIKSKSMEIAGYTVEDELLSFPIQQGNGTNSNAEVDGLIGNSLLRHFTIFLDYQHQQLIFEKGSDYKTRFPVDKSGMIVGRSDNDLPEIFYVAENTPAQEAGIQIGDVIKAIDNLKAGTLPSVTEITKMLRAEAGKKYKLKLIRNKQEIMLNLQLKNLYPPE